MSNYNERKNQALALVEDKKKELLALVSNDKAKYEQYKAVMVEFTQQKNLQGCSIQSIVHAATRIVQLGLNPNPLLSEAYVVPRGIYEYDKQERKKIKKGEVAELQIGTKGYKILGYRAGWTFTYQAVYACDKFEALLGDMIPKYTLVPNEDKREEDNGQWVYKNLKGILVFAKDPRGDIHKGYIKKQKLEKIRKKSPTQMFSQDALVGIWLDWAEEMYAKSGLKYFIKRLPIDSSVMDAIIHDEEGEREPDEVVEAEVVEPVQKKTALEVLVSIKNMDLSVYPFEDKAVVQGNTFKYASVLKDLGFICENGEWIYPCKDMQEFIEISTGAKVEFAKGFYGVRGKMPKENELALVELGFKWMASKKMYIMKEQVAA